MSQKTVLPIHGADHCPGGPDPLPCLASAAGAVPTPWATARNVTLSTSVASGTAWTNIALPDIVVAGSQAALTAVTDGIQIDENGIYLIVLTCGWQSGGGAGSWAQAAIKIDNTTTGTLGRFPSQKASPIAFEDFDFNTITRVYSIPGSQGAYPRIRASARQVGGATQTPVVLLSVLQLTPLFNGTPPFFAT